jgi:RNA 2',3'-cyclic 3'-phosphodiesterase
MRFFVAVDLLPEAYEEVSRMAEQLAATLASDSAASRKIKPNWIPLKNYHVTLKFLGEVAEDKRSGIEAALSEIARAQKSFEVHLESPGAFPDPARARVLWCGIGDPSGALRGLALEIDQKMVPHGFTSEAKPFVPHLSIARLRIASDVSPLISEVTAPTKPVQSRIERITLYESNTLPEGPVYTPVKSFSFGKS